MAYKAPVKEHLFLLNEVLNLQSYSNLPGFADATPDLTGQLLEEAGCRRCQWVLRASYPIQALRPLVKRCHFLVADWPRFRQ